MKKKVKHKGVLRGGKGAKKRGGDCERRSVEKCGDRRSREEKKNQRSDERGKEEWKGDEELRGEGEQNADKMKGQAE